MDPFSFLKISLNSDGSLTRHAPFPLSSPSNSSPSLSKDLPLNPAHNTWIRVFLPTTPPPPHNLPIILYFHGGGFILFSAASAPFHASCARLAASLPALVLSVEYRLAPEHRLPIAYHDAHNALTWLREQSANPSSADPWLRSHADFSRCFLMGSSSGGNIAYRAALRAAAGLNLEPLKLEGLILNQPYFGGEKRTESENRMADDRIVPLVANDLMWDLALPIGANRDHEFCNPTANEEEGVENLPPCFVRGFAGDPLIDRQRELARMLKRRGVRVVEMLDGEGHHAVELFNPRKAEELVEQVRGFVCGGREKL